MDSVSTIEMEAADAPAARGARAAMQSSVEVRRVGVRSVVVRARATSPLKLLTPRHAGNAAWVYASTYGGGLLAGDSVRLAVRVGEGAAAVLGTQASTKVYRSATGVAARQSLEATVAADGLLVLAPDPLSPFAGSVYEGRQRVDLDSDASLVLVDWVTCGRLAMGERWRLRSYVSRVDVRVDVRHAFIDAMALEGAGAEPVLPLRVGAFNCLASVLIIGERFADDVQSLVANVNAEPLERRASLLGVVSLISGGAVLRVGGPSAEAVGQYLQAKLRFLAAHLGDDPWARKW